MRFYTKKPIRIDYYPKTEEELNNLKEVVECRDNLVENVEVIQITEERSLEEEVKEMLEEE